MRQADIDEVFESSGSSPITAVAESVLASDECYTAEVGDELLCMFGVAPLQGFLGTTAAPWLLGTPALDRHSVLLMKTCRAYIARMKERYPHLLNYVDSRNTKSIRWLRRIGFTIHPAEPFKPGRVPFHKFEMR